MRKSAIVLGFGAFFLTCGLLFKFYAYPRLAVVPLDQNTRQVVEGPDSTYLDVENLKITTGLLTTVATVIGDPDASKAASEETGRDLAVWDKGQSTDNNGEAPPATAGTDRVVFDRYTGEAVNCCGELIDGVAAQHSGLVVKFPFQTQQKTYQYWDGTLQKPFPIDFKGEEEIEGVKAYRFEQSVPKEKYTALEVPGFLFGQASDSPAIMADRYYENERVIWVEPETGVMLKVSEHQKQFLEAPGVNPIVALDTVSVFTPETVKKNADEFGQKATLLKMVRSTFPITLGILGVALLAIGLLMAAAKLGRNKVAASGATAPRGAASGAAAGSARPSKPPVRTNASSSAQTKPVRTTPTTSGEDGIDLSKGSGKPDESGRA